MLKNDLHKNTAGIFDVAVIGAGVVGALCARELARYDLRVAVLERSADCSQGTSKANSAIVHAGFDAPPGTLKAKLNALGCGMMERLCGELDVKYRRNGSVVCAFGGEQDATVKELFQRGLNNGVPELQIITGERLRELEPAASDKITSALYAPSAGIVCPYGLTCAAADNAAANGAEFFFGHEVNGISNEDCVFAISCANGSTLKARYIVNAAGLFSDRVARMLGDDSFEIIPRRGEYMLFDRKCGGVAGCTMFMTPTKRGKGILVTPTVDGNLIIGPNAEVLPSDALENTETTAPGMREVAEGARLLVPSLDMRMVITSFAGIRATPSAGDFIIGASPANRRLINAAGIESPGLASSPAIALAVVESLGEAGLRLTPDSGFDPYRSTLKPLREMSMSQRAQAYRDNPACGRLVCRCEQVSEAEIAAAIAQIQAVGATVTLDGIKRRTRAGMGRCQAGFCTPAVLELIARHTGMRLDEITKSGDGSYVLAGDKTEMLLHK